MRELPSSCLFGQIALREGYRRDKCCAAICARKAMAAAGRTASQWKIKRRASISGLPAMLCRTERLIGN